MVTKFKLRTPSKKEKKIELASSTKTHFVGLHTREAKEKKNNKNLRSATAEGTLQFIRIPKYFLRILDVKKFRILSLYTDACKFSV